jgi:N-glycosylase/DNA lyase
VVPDIGGKAKEREYGLSELAKKVQALARDKDIRSRVDERVQEFNRLRTKGKDGDWFSELCFCIMTANSTARLGMKIQSDLGAGCITAKREEVEALLRNHGHRFARPRAEYICRARAHLRIKAIVESFSDEMAAREWLVRNVYGIGYKEASHFLRNTGHFNVAILDRHILGILREYSIIPDIPKTLTRKRYLDIEGKLAELSKMVNMPLGVLDLYLWYMRTGEILK